VRFDLLKISALGLARDHQGPGLNALLWLCIPRGVQPGERAVRNAVHFHAEERASGHADSEVGTQLVGGFAGVQSTAELNLG
jgi:hypothetical protein